MTKRAVAAIAKENVKVTLTPEERRALAAALESQDAMSWN